MSLKAIMKKCSIGLLVSALLCSGTFPVMVYAAGLQYYDYSKDTNITYSGTQIAYVYNDTDVVMPYPGIMENGVALADCEELFGKTLGLVVIFDQFENSVTVTNGTKQINLTVGSTTAVVDGVQQTMSVAPKKLLFADGSVRLFIPSRFVAEHFGYDYVWNSSTSTVKINKMLDFIEKQYNFQWKADDISEEYHQSEHSASIEKIESYSIEHADVIELYGIQSEQIDAFVDSGLLVLQMKDVVFHGDFQYYDNFESEHLTYALLSAFDDYSTLYVILNPEDTWHFVDQDGYVQMFLYKEDLDTNDLFTSSVSTDTPGYYSDEMIIPLPEQVEKITDKDDYSNLNFRIILSGNHKEFYRNNPIYNPYYIIKNYTVTYDDITDETILTFYTRSICGYSYSVEQNKLQVKAGKPCEIYSKIVILDPGHGGIDPGAQKNKILEKNINFKIINTYLKEAFRSSDIKVYYTRESDVLIDLYDRAALAEEIGADLFISLHMNANNSASVSGTEVYYCKDNNSITASGLRSSVLAKELVNNLSNAMNTKNRGATSADFVVVKYNTVPAVLIELGFMTNKAELNKLNDSTYQKKAADSIYNTVVRIFNEYPTGR